MELLAPYLEAHPEPLPSVVLAEGYDSWERFIHSDARLISIIAARGTGKTTALLKRAILKRDKDAIIMAPHRSMKRRYFEQLCNLAIELFGFDAQITRDSNDRMELYVNSHTISVEHSLLGYVMDYTSNKQLLYDEPESRIDIGNIDTIARYYNRMNSDVVFVGSICTPEDTTFKQFHAYAAAQSGYTATITAESFPERLASVQEMRRYMTDRVYRMEYMCDWSAGEDEGTWYT